MSIRADKNQSENNLIKRFNSFFKGMFKRTKKQESEKQSVTVNVDKSVARIVGAIVLIFAVLGVLSIAFFVKVSVDDARQRYQEEQIERLTEFIMPVVAVNTSEFESVDELSNYSAVKSSLVYAIEKHSSRLQYNDEGKMILPTQLVTEAAKNLFGEKVKLDFITFDINEVLFEYNNDNDCYYFAATGHIKSFQPKITEYNKKGDVTTILVEYQPMEVYYAKKQLSLKYYYLLKGQDGNEHLISIKKDLN